MADARAAASRVGSTHISWSGDYGGYMNVSFQFDMVGTVTFGSDGLPDNLHVKISNFSESHDWGDVAGGGFINVGGFMWAEGDYARAFVSAEDLSDESTDLVWSQLTETIPNFSAMNVWGLYASDESSPPAVSGVIQGTYWEKDFPLSGDPDVNMNICQSYTRWRENTDPAYAHVSTAGDFNITFHDLFTDYFPGSSRSGSSWRSQDSSGMGDFARSSSRWSELKNTQGKAADTDAGLFRSGNSWAKLPLQ